MSIQTILRHSRSISWFGVVGASAALVHYIAAVTLEHGALLTAGWANVVGFLCAFPVSYFGHLHLSFPSSGNHKRALYRFFSVACLGFAANQALVLLGLHYLKLPFWLVLGIVMVIVAVSTYLLSYLWAFRRTS